MKELTEGEKNIIRNLRQDHGEQLMHIDDRLLLKRYNEWNISDKSEERLEWLLDR